MSSNEIISVDASEKETDQENTTKMNQIAPSRQIDETEQRNTPQQVPNLSSRLAKLLFLTHFVAIIILVIFICIHGFLNKRQSFNPVHWFAALFTAAATSALAAFSWLLFTLHCPPKALKASLWLAPSLSCGTSVLLLTDSTGFSLVFAVPALVVALVQALYACWITPRLHHAYEILRESVEIIQPKFSELKCFCVAVVVSLFYYCFWSLGVAGIAADKHSKLAPLYLLFLLLSLAWTMQTIRYILYVGIARIAYMKLVCITEVDTGASFLSAAMQLLGNICYGSIVVPIVVTIRGMARAMSLVAGDSDEFLFSCANCYMGVADRLVLVANRWGFVHVGVYGLGLQTASRDTWMMFVKKGMESLINSDISGSFCFYCAVASGGFSATIAGSWMLAVDKRNVTEVTVYSFIIGYFMTRIAMAWPQACVAVYHVAYAENSPNSEFGSCITLRIRELRLSAD